MFKACGGEGAQGEQFSKRFLRQLLIHLIYLVDLPNLMLVIIKFK